MFLVHFLAVSKQKKSSGACHCLGAGSITCAYGRQSCCKLAPIAETLGRGLAKHCSNCVHCRVLVGDEIEVTDMATTKAWLVANSDQHSWQGFVPVADSNGVLRINRRVPCSNPWPLIAQHRTAGAATTTPAAGGGVADQSHRTMGPPLGSGRAACRQ